MQRGVLTAPQTSGPASCAPRARGCPSVKVPGSAASVSRAYMMKLNRVTKSSNYTSCRLAQAQTATGASEHCLGPLSRSAALKFPRAQMHGRTWNARCRDHLARPRDTCRIRCLRLLAANARQLRLNAVQADCGQLRIHQKWLARVFKRWSRESRYVDCAPA
jgi:hypothetical protein